MISGRFAFFEATTASMMPSFACRSGEARSKRSTTVRSSSRVRWRRTSRLAGIRGPMVAPSTVAGKLEPPVPNVLERLVRKSGHDGPLAYHDPQWRDRAPLVVPGGRRGVDPHWSRRDAAARMEVAAPRGRCAGRATSSSCSVRSDARTLRRREVARGNLATPDAHHPFAILRPVLVAIVEAHLQCELLDRPRPPW